MPFSAISLAASNAVPFASIVTTYFVIISRRTLGITVISCIDNKNFELIFPNSNPLKSC
jgi:hypothetical protein